MNRPHFATRSPLGFSLVEMMITVAIIAILAVVAAPQMQNQIEGSQVTAATNDLLGTLAQARSNAIRFGRQETEALPATLGGIDITTGISAVTFAANGTTDNVGLIELENDARKRCIRIIGSGKAFLEDCAP